MKKSELYQQRLNELKDYLSAKGWDASIAPADTVQNYQRIVVKLYVGDNPEVFWPAELVFLPGLEKDMHDFTILQCYIPMVVNVPAGMDIALAEMITKINPKLALGGFGLLSAFHVLFYKHNTLIEDDQISTSFPAIMETLSVASYLLVNFQEAFNNVVEGKMSVSEAMSTMPFAAIYK